MVQAHLHQLISSSIILSAMMLKVYFAALFLIFVIYPFKEKKPKQDKVDQEISITTYPSEHGGFGYNIFVDEVCLIHQPHIPAIRSTVGFSSHENAKKVANLVVVKISQGQMPPAVTLADLRELQIIN
jgi:hypothetical protein